MKKPFPPNPHFKDSDYDRVDLHNGMTASEVLEIIQDLQDSSELRIETDYSFFADDGYAIAYFRTLKESAIERFKKEQKKYYAEMEKYNKWYVSSGQEEKDKKNQERVRKLEKELEKLKRQK